MPAFQTCGIVVPDHVPETRHKERKGCQLEYGHSGDHLETLKSSGSLTFILWSSNICEECDCQDEEIDPDAYCVGYHEISAEEAMTLIHKAREKKT